MESNFVIPLPDKYVSKERTFSVNFTCQRCCQPLKLHSSFRDLDRQALSELTAPPYPNADRKDRIDLIETFRNRSDESSVMRKIVLPIKFTDAGSDFMVVDDLSNLPFDSNYLGKVTTQLFDLMSNYSDVDHPLCEECTDNILDQMDQQLRIAEEEVKEYRDFQEQLEMEDEEEDLDKLKSDLLKYQETEAHLQEELSQMEVKQGEMKEMLRTLENECEILQREEDKRWQEYCRIQRQVLLSEDNLHSVENQIMYTQGQLDKLSKTNVFNATFHIWHSGHFGTINGFRLGRLPNIPVEWAEINAAWGQTVLLLHSLAKKINLTFKKYRLVPMGNHSLIESIEGNKVQQLPLYCCGGIRYVLDNRFDQAMVGFLDCLQQFKETVEQGDASFHLPYRMEKGRIIDKRTEKYYSIKVQLNSEEQWTKALKFMLTNLKWALAWVSTQFQSNTSSAVDAPPPYEEVPSS
ncbi:beclin-1-like [Argiope bruennichi]|uniref:Beclin-1 like protein n=1 Tax=Argiope bruennichi TaxID=94029 RepID=A0A8T0FBG2_ARGBR|nr:beclin-1-like [Argiope bruennichi]KAF8786759.1 Beclin-1 like protein [Argiope bruennichi]